MKTFSPSRGSTLLAPVVAGFALYLLLAACDQGQSSLLHRYMLGHWVNRMTSILFCVGAVSLMQAAWGIWWQGRQLLRVSLPKCDPEASREERAAAQELSRKLESLPAWTRRHWLGQRAAKLLAGAAREGQGHDLAVRLNTLADEDLDRQAQRYGLPRILVWAMPLLGFLGTVLGISEAMGSLQVGGESDLPRMMSGLQANLNVAFDTTAQALVLSILMMFGVFVGERNETRLLGEIGTAAGNWAHEVLGGLREPQPRESAPHDFRPAQAAWDELARQCVQVWERAARTQFDALAREPSSARRIEAALVDLTSALGQLQRQLNYGRGEPDDARAAIRKWNPDRDRKAA